ncbi:MAG TPA: hypothetical protein VHT97_08925 [Acidimicrobiales bacterium]|nr:hypothetical protein [Acidimicrobiales bacterium]
MSTRTTLRETARDRRELAADAGYGGFSITSALAGVLVAYGAFAILLGLAAAAVGAAGSTTDLSTDWERLGTTGGLVVAALLLVAYLFGGYVAGRMARRNGLLHGLAVAVLGLVVVGVVAALARNSGATDSAAANLRSLGIPTTADEYGHAATVAGIASLIGLFVGSLVGGILGERWHGRLLARAADPTVGAQAAAAREAEEARTRANLSLARSEGRVRAHELERERDRTQVAERERALDDERERQGELAQERDQELARADAVRVGDRPQAAERTSRIRRSSVPRRDSLS